METPIFKPGNFGYPEETMVNHFLNALRQLKKTVRDSKDTEELQIQIEHFINVNRRVSWPHPTSGVFHKDEAEKAVEKVVTEFQRYIKDLQNDPSPKSYQDLIDAISLVEAMEDRLKERS